jgi:hypothetical protein
MQLQLRPSTPRFHPLMRPMYRRAGFAGIRGLGDGTCQTPQPGVPQVYPPCPTFAPISSGTPASQYTGQPAPAVYQAPTPVSVPACSQDTRPGGAAFSAACIAQVLAAQQQNFQLANNANFVVDYTNCVNSGLSPAVCGSRTYGLTPAGGFTSDAGGGPGGTPLILDANGNPVSGVPVYTGPPLPGMTPGAGGGAPTLASSITFTNLSSGNSSKLTVGDRWQIQISNAARNAPVSVTGGQNGANATTPMGTTDSSGNWTSNGQVTADMIGSWQEAWSVGGQPVGTISFSVVPAAGGASSSTPSTSTSGAGQTVTGSFMDLFSKSTTIGGASIPDWALIGAGLVVVFLMMRKG